MIYADADYYQNKYLLGRAEVIPLSEFLFWAKQASLEVDRHTMNRLHGTNDYELPDRVKDCVCDLAEYLYVQEENAGYGAISSETVGPHSVSYDTESVAGTSSESIISKYLSNTGLLYKGVGRCRGFPNLSGTLI